MTGEIEGGQQPSQTSQEDDAHLRSPSFVVFPLAVHIQLIHGRDSQ